MAGDAKFPGTKRKAKENEVSLAEQLFGLPVAPVFEAVPAYADLS